jgi:hypothetical protein
MGRNGTGGRWKIGEEANRMEKGEIGRKRGKKEMVKGDMEVSGGGQIGR